MAPSESVDDGSSHVSSKKRRQCNNYHQRSRSQQLQLVQQSGQKEKQSYMRRTHSVCSASSLHTMSTSHSKEETIVMDWSATRRNNKKMERFTIPRPSAAMPSSCNKEQPWMDWVESGIEFFGCDNRGIGTSTNSTAVHANNNNNNNTVIGRALMLRRQWAGGDDHTSNSLLMTTEQDFSRMHEDFFEALLKEQVERAGAGSETGSDATSWEKEDVVESMTSPPLLSQSHSRDDSLGSLGSSVSAASSITHETLPSMSSTKTQHNRRRRPLQLPKRRNRGRVSPVQVKDHPHLDTIENTAARSKSGSASSSSNQVSLSEILAKQELQEPTYYLDPNCILQKDKGKGEPLGHAISANGRDTCLDKLREKMAIVVQVSGEEHKVTTGMKRRPAKVSQRTSKYIETRSMIEVRLGFLSMQYGLLLQWDHVHSNKVVFCTLRKMCHDSFYAQVAPAERKTAKKTKQQQQQQQRGRRCKPTEQLPLVIRTQMGDHALYQRSSGTEVVLIDAPHRIAPPSPQGGPSSQLAIAIDSISGLTTSKSNTNWTLHMAFDEQTEIASLQYCPQKDLWMVQRDPMVWQLTPATLHSFTLSGLSIQLWQGQAQVSSMTLPLGEFMVQPCQQPITSLQLTLPFTHDSNIQLTLELKLESPYAHWLYQELQARKVEELDDGNDNDDDDGVPDAASLSSASVSSSSSSLHATSKHDDNDWMLLLDWMMCGLCFKEYSYVWP